MAIDGSKLKAVNNRDKNFTEHKLKARLAQVEESVGRYLTELDRADREPTLVSEARVSRLKEKMEAAKAYVQKLREIGERLQKASDKQISLTDPDARSTRRAPRRYRFDDPRKQAAPVQTTSTKLTGHSWVSVYKRLRTAIKIRHYSPKTWQAYKTRIRHFQTFTQSKDPENVSMEDVKGFLAMEKNVAASSQNQAFNALLFLFRHVLKKEFGKVEGRGADLGVRRIRLIVNHCFCGPPNQKSRTSFTAAMACAQPAVAARIPGAAWPPRAQRPT